MTGFQHKIHVYWFRDENWKVQRHVLEQYIPQVRLNDSQDCPQHQEEQADADNSIDHKPEDVQQVGVYLQLRTKKSKIYKARR